MDRTDLAVSTPSTRACPHSWCAGIFCAISDNGERFHRGILSAESNSAETIGVDLVCNDYADGATSGPLIDVTFAVLSANGVAQHSVGLTPEAALRHAATLIRAASLALASR
ncbi:hypothetical protein [Actinoplanes sp. NPDC051494]|uniref:hypothetical protein n=1 Tax=Actinoplanes sp. NPDC051494 TaxID=3363907 RepID=UPI00378991F9